MVRRFYRQVRAFTEGVYDWLPCFYAVGFGGNGFGQDDAVAFGHVSAYDGRNGAKVGVRTVMKFFQRTLA